MELCPKFATQIGYNQIWSVEDGAGDFGVDGSCCPTKQSTAAIEGDSWRKTHSLDYGWDHPISD